MSRKAAVAVVALALMLAPMGATRAQARWSAGGSNSLGSYNSTPVTYTPGQSSGGCTGTPIVVFGSSALQDFIQQAAQDYCATFADKTTAPDVEYAVSPLADSCPGMAYAADNGDGNEIGAADVFAPACTGADARAASKIVDTLLGVNVVEAIAQCPGANDGHHDQHGGHCPEWQRRPLAELGHHCPGPAVAAGARLQRRPHPA